MRSLYLCIIVLLFLIGQIPASAQLLGRYQPGVFVASGVVFNERFANESSIFLKNDLVLYSQEGLAGVLCLNIGYARRSYKLDYLIPELGESVVPGIRNALSIQSLALLQFTSIPKIRKNSIPYCGFGIQAQFSNTIGAEREVLDFFGFKKRNPVSLLFEIGTSFVTHNWPRFFTSLQFELPGTSQGYFENVHDPETGEVCHFRYNWKDLPCIRLIIGCQL